MPWQDDTTVEVGIALDGSGPLAASPTFTDVVLDTRRLTIKRGRPSVSQTFSAGNLRLRLSNRDGAYDPNNPSSPHWPNVQLGAPVRIRAIHDSITYPLFYGNISRLPLAYPDRNFDAVVELEAVENTAILRTTRLFEQVYAEELSNTRISNILDDAGWPAAARDLNSGVASVAAVDHTGEAGGLLDEAVEVEQGQFFVAKDGKARFLHRVAFSTAGSQATFDVSSGLKYMDVVLAYDDDLLINRAEITKSNDVIVTVSDAASIAEHGESAFPLLNDSIIGGPQALNVAEWIVGKHKDVAVRVVGLKLRPQADANLWPEVLGRDLQDLVTVNFTPLGADPLSQVVAVESIQIDITNNVWDVFYGCHPLSELEQQEFWILDVSELGVSTRLA